MSLSLLAEKLMRNDERFVSNEKIKEYCKTLNISYIKAITYLVKYKYVKRILKGFFYVPTIEERKLHTGGPHIYEAIIKAMEYKKVKNWYFGLETAIKFNNITHEFFTITFVVSDTIFRAKTINIFGNRIKFVKLNKGLFGFGIKNKHIPYSDLEKTLLDLIHLRVYGGKSKKAIKDELVEWFDEVDKTKLKKYSKNYSKTVREVLEELI